MMSIFWKIYLTIFIFTIILFIIGVAMSDCDNEKGVLLIFPLVIQIVLLLLLIFLNLIWDWSWF